MSYLTHHPSLCKCLVLLIGCLVASPWALADTYRLEINEKTIDLIGQPQTAVLANDGLPAPTLHWREGEDVTLEVSNKLKEQTSIH